MPFEDVDAAETHEWEAEGDGDGGHFWPLFCKIALEKGEAGAQAGPCARHPCRLPLSP